MYPNLPIKNPPDKFSIWKYFWKAVIVSYQSKQKLQILGCFTFEKISRLMSQIFLMVAIRGRSILTSLMTHKLYDTPEKHCVFRTWVLLLENNVSNPLIVDAKKRPLPSLCKQGEIISRRSFYATKHFFCSCSAFFTLAHDNFFISKNYDSALDHTFKMTDPYL